MSTIDDPVEATLRQYPKAEQTLLKEIVGTTLDLFPPGPTDQSLQYHQIAHSWRSRKGKGRGIAGA